MTAEKKASIHYVLRLGLTLFLLTAVVAGLLGFVNGVTKDKIAAIEAGKTEAAMQAVLAPGVSVGDKVTDFADETGLVREVYQTSDGFVIQVEPSGFGGEIKLMVGVSGMGSVTGISIVSHSETASLGANAAASTQVGVRFRDQFIGQSGALAVSKDGGSIDALTGATVTSRAVTAGVNAALACAGALGLRG